MALRDFTTFDDIRAALGVSKDDIEDATLSLDVYEFNLIAELEEAHANLLTQYTVAHDKEEGTRTAAEQRLVRSTFVFATFATAKQLIASLPLFAPREHSDGKAHVTRFQQDLSKMIMRVEQQYDLARRRMLEALATVQSAAATAATPRVFMASALPTNPVTGA